MSNAYSSNYYNLFITLLNTVLPGIRNNFEIFCFCRTQFKVGENVEALWNTDGQKYPGVIQNILPNGTVSMDFPVLFSILSRYCSSICKL